MTVETELLARGSHVGPKPFEVPIPIGHAQVRCELDLTSLVGNTTTRVSWSLELSQDDGLSWLPWGACGCDMQIAGKVPDVHGLAVNLPRPTNPLRRLRMTVTLTEPVSVSAKFILSDIPLDPVLSLAPDHHSVAFDNVGAVSGFGDTTLTTPAFTIGGTNRAAILGHAAFVATSGMSASVGGVAGTAVTGARGNDGSSFVELWQVTAPPTGSQTATMSWTTSVAASVGVITAQGVDQTTPVNNSGYTQGASPLSKAMTSAAGDLTVTISANSFASTTQTTNQTQKTTNFGCVDIGPGTANPTHTWTLAGSNETLAYANFNQLAAGGAITYPELERCTRGVGRGVATGVAH